MLMIVGMVTAKDDKYGEMMSKSIDVVYNSSTIAELQQAVNDLDRVGGAEKTKWEPYYYATFGYIMMANNESDPVKKDAYLDQAKAVLAKGFSIKTDESELVALDGFISMIRVSVDPASRGPQYTGQAMQLYQKAITLNPENPRALGLMARMQLGVAQFFKAEPAEACATARTALEKFGTYKPANQFAPMWGKGMVEDILNNCK